jgi:hypothetical protein
MGTLYGLLKVMVAIQKKKREMWRRAKKIRNAPVEGRAERSFQ